MLDGTDSTSEGSALQPDEPDGQVPGSEDPPFLTEDAAKSPFAEVNLFGLKLEVSNPHLAELLDMDAKSLLSMDAKTALTTELSDLPAAAKEKTDQFQQVAEADIEAMLAVPTAKEQEEDRQRRQLRDEVGAMGDALGFDVSGPGIWASPTGVTIIVRVVDKPVSFAAASHFVVELAERRELLAGPDATALFVVESQQTADVFKVAIRQRQVYHLMRTVSAANLREIRGLLEAGTIEHGQAVVLLAPVADIDVGEMLSVLKSGGVGSDLVLE